MSWIRSYLTGLAILFAVVGGSLPTRAQDYQPLTNTEDFSFQSDWFKPLYKEDFYDGRQPNTGFFFAYDRAYMSVSRKHTAIDNLQYEIRPFDFPGQGGPVSGIMTAENSTDYGGDWTYGNRFELGYMQENDKGWLFNAWKLDNPNVQRHEDNTRRNERTTTLNPNGTTTTTTLIVRDTDFRLNPIGDIFLTLNAFNFYSFDLSRTWRLKPLHNGMVIEPLFGAKYVRIRDHSDRADYVRDFTTPLPFGPPGGAGQTFEGIDDWDGYIRELVYTDNDMFGGQFGFRSFLRRGRWLISTDLRGFTMNNWQNRERNVTAELNSEEVEHTFDDTGALDSFVRPRPATVVDFRNDTFYDQNSRFVYGGELRLEGTFELTQYVAIRGGMNLLVFGDGVGRGVTGTDEAFTAGGVTAGFTINR